MILKEFNYYLKKGTTLEEIQGSLIKKVNRWCDPFTGCVAHVFDTVLLKHWIVASDNVVGLYKLDKNILLFNDFQMIYERLDKIEEALPKDDVKEDIIDRLDKVEENLSSIQNELNDKKDELSHQEKLKEQLEQEIAELDKKIEEAKARGEGTTELERQKAEKERELATVTQNITNLINEITNLEQTINNLLGQKDSIEKELEEHKPKEIATKEYIDEIKVNLDSDIATKANQATTYTKTEVDTKVNAKANANATVNLTGNQTIAGNKTLSGTTTFNGAITSKGANTFSGNNTFNTGQVTFNNKAPICNVAPTRANHLATKDYVDKKAKAYIIETYNNTSTGSWYRVWSDKWCEQGGFAPNTTSRYDTVTLLKPYKGTNYCIYTSHMGGKNECWWPNDEQIMDVTTTSFKMNSQKNNTATCRNWKTCGYIA
ncbi:hypothetical protein CVIC8964_1301 [Campylobacter vicugnae]|uniref:Uncharacterized protein n=1 Tax=Campylobacter vicugnae TaxID=1660076 RepID=A0A1X9T2E9_9BACT|nr:hypothetical protein [Campylobacter sp. RM8964]ARR02690.1 hypothetical protein CVIC8964_1301 [Campylobacter sp. RM8964]